MTLAALRRAYERLIRERFPTAVVVADRTDRSPHWPPYLHVHCLPDGRLREYADFRVHELPDLIRAGRLPDAMIFPYGERATRESFPGICPHGSSGRRKPVRYCAPALHWI
jgi:hypothetical protein